jgi:hypothetical protein
VGTLTYYAPDGEHVFDPAPELLRALISEKGQGYYDGGRGGGALQMLRQTPDGIEDHPRPARAGMVLPGPARGV